MFIPTKDLQAWSLEIVNHIYLKNEHQFQIGVRTNVNGFVKNLVLYSRGSVSTYFEQLHTFVFFQSGLIWGPSQRTLKKNSILHSESISSI